MEAVNQFEQGSEFQNLLQNVSRRLGFLYNIPKREFLSRLECPTF